MLDMASPHQYSTRVDSPCYLLTVFEVTSCCSFRRHAARHVEVKHVNKAQLQTHNSSIPRCRTIATQLAPAQPYNHTTLGTRHSFPINTHTARRTTYVHTKALGPTKQPPVDQPINPAADHPTHHQNTSSLDINIRNKHTRIYPPTSTRPLLPLHLSAHVTPLRCHLHSLGPPPAYA